MARLTPAEIEAGRQMGNAPAPAAAPAAPAKPRYMWDVQAGPNDMPPIPTTAMTRGAIQGASLGYSDEAAGGIGASINALLQLAGTKKSNETFSQAYARIRDSERQANTDAENSDPAAYNTAKVLGTLVPTLLAPEAKVAQIGLGALAGAGNSDADTAGGVLKDAAVGGAVTGTLGKVLGAGANVARVATNKIASKALDAATKAGSVDAPSIVGGAVQGVKDLVTPFKQSGDVDWGKLGGAATALAHDPVVTPIVATTGAAATGAAKAAIGKAVVNDVNNGGTGAIGDNIANSQGAAAASQGAAAGTNVAANSDTSKSATGQLMDFVRNTLGMDTPGGQQNAPDSAKQKAQADADAVKAGDKDGLKSPDVSNIITRDGKDYLVTASGREVPLN